MRYLGKLGMIRRAVGGAAAALAASAPIAASAAGGDPSGPFGSYFGTLVRVILSLLVVVILIVWLIRFLARKNGAWTRQRGIRLLGGVGVGPNKSIQVVEIGAALYIVGVGENISLLAKMDNPDEVEDLIRTMETPAMPPLEGVSSWLRRMREGKMSVEPDGREQAASFQEVFQAKMNRVLNRREELDAWKQTESRKERSDAHDT